MVNFCEIFRDIRSVDGAGLWEEINFNPMMVLDTAGPSCIEALVLQRDEFELAYSFYGLGAGNRSRGALFGGQRRGKVAYQFGLFNNLDIDPFVVHGGPGPIDTVGLGDYRTQPGGGVDILFFPGDEQRSLFFGVGLYQQTYTFVGRSISTGGLFDLGQRYVFEGAFSLGFMGELERGTSLGIGWHTHLGWNFTFSSRR